MLFATNVVWDSPEILCTARDFLGCEDEPPVFRGQTRARVGETFPVEDGAQSGRGGALLEVGQPRFLSGSFPS